MKDVAGLLVVSPRGFWLVRRKLKGGWRAHPQSSTPLPIATAAIRSGHALAPPDADMPVKITLVNPEQPIAIGAELEIKTADALFKETPVISDENQLAFLRMTGLPVYLNAEIDFTQREVEISTEVLEGLTW